MSTTRQHSRQDWTSGGTLESIKIGCLQRIADAVEVTTQNFVQLQYQKKWAEEQLQECRARCEKLQRAATSCERLSRNYEEAKTWTKKKLKI